jgi:hypothetical protein
MLSSVRIAMVAGPAVRRLVQPAGYCVNIQDLYELLVRLIFVVSVIFEAL